MNLLEIYLDDHWAGAAAGSALAERLAGQNAASVWAEDLAWVADQIRKDQQSLADMRRRLRFSGGTMKRSLALLGERLGRLKPNGRLVRYSPLSRLLEVEALISGVSAKQRLWIALQQMDRERLYLPGVDLEDLERRAASQLEVLDSVHRAVSPMAFDGPKTPRA